MTAGQQRVRRTQQERRSEAESKLLRSAVELIADQGAGTTSLAQIGERAGFSRGIVNHHFGTKADLVRRIIAESHGAFGAKVTAHIEGSGLEAVLALADAYLRELTIPNAANQGFLVMWAEAAGPGRELRPDFAKVDRVFRGAVRDLVARGIRDGSIRASTSPDAVAAGLVAQLRGIGLELLVDPVCFDLPAIQRDLIATLSAALTPSGPPVLYLAHTNREGNDE